MQNINQEIEQLNDKIEKIEKQLAIKSLGEFFNKINDLEIDFGNNFYFSLLVNEKKMRRDCSYDPQESYNEAFNVYLEQSENTLEFKECFKDLILFCVKYQGPRCYFEISFNNNDHLENKNDFLNKLVLCLVGNKPEYVNEVISLLNNKDGYFYKELPKKQVVYTNDVNMEEKLKLLNENLLSVMTERDKLPKTNFKTSKI